MNANVETRLIATLEEQAGSIERLDVGSLADRVVVRGRRLRRRRAVGAAAAAALMVGAVGAVVAVPTWVSGTEKPVHPPTANQLPEPSTASPSAAPSELPRMSPQLSEGLIRRWLDGLPQVSRHPLITGDPSLVFETVNEVHGDEAEARYRSVARLRTTGQVLGQGDPHGAALDQARERLALALEPLGPDGRPAGAVTLTVIDVRDGQTLAMTSGLDLTTTVRGWLDGRVVLDTDVEVRATVAIWDPETPEKSPRKVADGRVADVAESGHRILLTHSSQGRTCSEIWEIADEVKPFLVDCGPALIAISDEGTVGYVKDWQAAKDLWSGVPMRFALPTDLPITAARWDASGDVVLTIGLPWSGEAATVSCHLADGLCVRVVPSP